MPGQKRSELPVCCLYSLPLRPWHPLYHTTCCPYFSRDVLVPEAPGDLRTVTPRLHRLSGCGHSHSLCCSLAEVTAAFSAGLCVASALPAAVCWPPLCQSRESGPASWLQDKRRLASGWVFLTLCGLGGKVTLARGFQVTGGPCGGALGRLSSLCPSAAPNAHLVLSGLRLDFEA